MSFKLFLRTCVFLVILFVILYVGMNNTQRIGFSFPIVTEKILNAPAALIFFGIFAVGVLAGTMLGAGGEKESGEGKKRR